MLIKKRDLIKLSLTGASIACMFLGLWLGGAALLGFLTFGLLLTLLYANAVLVAIRKNLLLFLFPAWAGLTIIWADYPMAALRLDIQLFLTFIIFTALTGVVPMTRVLEFLCAFFALALVSVLVSSNTVSIYQTGEVVRVGVLGSKNNVSAVGASALTAGIMLIASPDKSRFATPLALLAIGTAIATILQARSLGTFMSVALCIALAAFVWNMKNMIHSAAARNITAFGLLTVNLSAIVGVIFFFNYDSYVAMMQSIGKDPTITGRTFIWSIGFRIIEENFWGGVGLSSFWSERNSDAVLLWITGDREIGAYYGFHNLYIHTWVETGLPGFLIMSAILIRMLSVVVQYARTGCSVQQAAAAGFALFLVMKSFFEVPIFHAFSINTFFFFVIWQVLNQAHSKAPQGAVPFRTVRSGQKTAQTPASSCNS